MVSGDRPFHEEDYREEEGCFAPIVDILLGNAGHKISVYVDTGCSTGIFVLKEQVEGIDIGQKISDEPSRCVVADGDIISGEEYLCSLLLGGEMRPIIVTVVDPRNKIGHEEINKMTPLLGRNFLDHYDVLFRGKARKLALFR